MIRKNGVFVNEKNEFVNYNDNYDITNFKKYSTAVSGLALLDSLSSKGWR